MGEFLESPAVQFVFLVAALAAAVAFGIYVIGKIQRGFSGEGETASKLLADFRELHSQGELSDEEFRTIKSMLSERLEREVKGNKQDG